ncbi:MAG: alpha/beta hydrolase [Deltaproteobacteria bacterium]|nr:alpha/beta hydrolase [Deltaproteobacteria bacterium]
MNNKSVQIPLNNDKTIDGKIYGSGNNAIIFSNMDTNVQEEWDPIVEVLEPEGYMILTYNYFDFNEKQHDTLEDVVLFTKNSGAKKIIIIGASRGGVASLKVATRSVNDKSVIGVAAISAQIEYEGTTFYSTEELRSIKIPKLLIDSELDGGAEDNRKMIKILNDPKDLLFYKGDAHGTQIFENNRESLVKRLRDFISSVFENSI